MTGLDVKGYISDVILHHQSMASPCPNQLHPPAPRHVAHGKSLPASHGLVAGEYGYGRGPSHHGLDVLLVQEVSIQMVRDHL